MKSYFLELWHAFLLILLAAPFVLFMYPFTSADEAKKAQKAYRCLFWRLMTIVFVPAAIVAIPLCWPLCIVLWIFSSMIEEHYEIKQAATA